jgi:hypothetical protein
VTTAEERNQGEAEDRPAGFARFFTVFVSKQPIYLENSRISTLSEDDLSGLH